jgi:RNA polymerase sigma-70 factor (ECF subfamily)
MLFVDFKSATTYHKTIQMKFCTSCSIIFLLLRELMNTNHKIDEYDLGLNYINGHDESLGELYKHYYSSLIMIAYKYTQNTEKSKDLIGYVFEKLLCIETKKRSTIFLHPAKGLYPLLISIIKNKALDDIKQHKVRQEIKKQIVSLTNLISTNSIFSRFEEDAIKQLLYNLPKREQEILQLHLQGFKNEEIANQLNISYNTVRNTLHSAKQRVKKLWQLFM